MYPSVKNVKPLDEYKLQLFFDNGEEKIFDLSSYLDHGIFQELKDKSIFNKVHISFDTIEWPNGIDMDPEILYSESFLLSRSFA